MLSPPTPRQVLRSQPTRTQCFTDVRRQDGSAEALESDPGALVIPLDLPHLNQASADSMNIFIHRALLEPERP